MNSASRRFLLLCSLCSAPAVAAFACGGSSNGAAQSSSGASMSAGGAGSTGSGGSGGNLFTSSSSGVFTGPFADFPKDPIVDPSAPPSAPTLFGAPSSGMPGGPCLFEPEPGALFPNNWLRPRFRYSADANQNLFEIRLHADNEINDLVVYTADPSWKMPKDIWTGLAQHINDAKITVSIRSGHFDGTQLDSGPFLGEGGDFTIAPADASGAIVYWTTSMGSSLKGFLVGDESVGVTLTPPQVKMPTVGNAQVSCIGCHTSTPDGKFVGFTAQGPWGNAIASVEAATAGAQPPFLGQGALGMLDQFGELGIQVYSKAHWTNGDHVMVTPFDAHQNAKLAWVDLEAATSGQGVAYGFIQRTGDAHGVGAPTWSHDGKTIVYVSSDAETTGRLDVGDADLYAVPYNDRMGGAATPVPGASDPAVEEYYPAFSSDDALLAFNITPKGTNMYNQPQAELYVIPYAGGVATRLAANDPAACTGKKSPGITNSWPKWAPEAATVNGKTYYWLIFSSTRAPKANPQLFITGVVVEGTNVHSYGSIYLWNQPEAENNHTPAWDVFEIPPSPPPQ